LINNAKPNVGHGVEQRWVDDQTKRFEAYKAAGLIAEIGNCHQQLDRLLKGSTVLSDPAQRGAVAPEAILLVKKMASASAQLDTLSRQKSHSQSQADSYFVLEAALGDQEAIGRIEALAGSKDSSEFVRGSACQIKVRWLHAGKDLTRQTAVVDDLERLDRANLDDNALCAMTLGFSIDAASPALRDRLISLATKTMTVEQTRAAELAKRAAEHERELNSAIGKPLVVAGRTNEGKDFSTADLKGKVILVDFWASWCGPCKAQLPKLQQIYADYHPKGLEIVGISNDYDPDALNSFLDRNPLPWPQLFDPQAAANTEFNPVSKQLHVLGIPQTFVIDRSGVVRKILDAATNESDLKSTIETLLAEPG
jgi:peroxiredoxin